MARGRAILFSDRDEPRGRIRLVAALDPSGADSRAVPDQLRPHIAVTKDPGVDRRRDFAGSVTVERPSGPVVCNGPAPGDGGSVES